MKVTTQNRPPKDWDDWLAGMGTQGGFLQTTTWADICHHVRNTSAWFIEITDQSGQRQAGMMAIHEPGGETGGLVSWLKAAITGQSKGILVVGDGPVVNTNADASIWGLLLGKLEDLRKEIGVYEVKIGNFPVRGSWCDFNGIDDAFSRANFNPKIWETAIVDLTMAEEVLWDALKPNARKGIKRCQREGVTVKVCQTREEFETYFFNPFYQTRKREGGGTTPKHWWGIDRPSVYRYFYALDGNQDVCGMLGTYAFNGLVVEIMSERTGSALASRTPVQDILHWHAFNIHRDAGDVAFDLAGYNPSPADNKEKGIRSFKEKWRGQPIRLRSYVARKPPFLYRIIAAILKKGRR